jgi:hypothetical protein
LEAEIIPRLGVGRAAVAAAGSHLEAAFPAAAAVLGVEELEEVGDFTRKECFEDES